MSRTSLLELFQLSCERLNYLLTQLVPQNLINFTFQFEYHFNAFSTFLQKILVNFLDPEVYIEHFC